jgi:hypothetical protein
MPYGAVAMKKSLFISVLILSSVVFADEQKVTGVKVIVGEKVPVAVKVPNQPIVSSHVESALSGACSAGLIEPVFAEGKDPAVCKDKLTLNLIADPRCAPIFNECADKANGFDKSKAVFDRPFTDDTGWVEGGHNQEWGCKKVAGKAQLQPGQFWRKKSSSEKSDKSWGVAQYKYYCSIEIFDAPFIVKQNKACGIKGPGSCTIEVAQPCRAPQFGVESYNIAYDQKTVGNVNQRQDSDIYATLAIKLQNQSLCLSCSDGPNALSKFACVVNVINDYYDIIETSSSLSAALQATVQDLKADPVMSQSQKIFLSGVEGDLSK